MHIYIYICFASDVTICIHICIYAFHIAVQRDVARALGQLLGNRVAGQSAIFSYMDSADVHEAIMDTL